MKHNDVQKMLVEYHKCDKFFNNAGRALQDALQSFDQPLVYANRWTHSQGDRVGVRFYDMVQSRNRWISVPVSVFEDGNYEEFARKYCKVADTI